jgi:hypothetical protein
MTRAVTFRSSSGLSSSQESAASAGLVRNPPCAPSPPGFLLLTALAPTGRQGIRPATVTLRGSWSVSGSRVPCVPRSSCPEGTAPLSREEPAVSSFLPPSASHVPTTARRWLAPACAGSPRPVVPLAEPHGPLRVATTPVPHCCGRKSRSVRPSAPTFQHTSARRVTNLKPYQCRCGT